MLGGDLLEYIFKRLAPTGEALFDYDEVKEWQPEFFSVLKAQGLLCKAQPLKDIECRGCEEYCLMPVEVYPALDSSRPARAFISCDKRDDIGRVKVDMVRLEQWQITIERLVVFCSEQLGLSPAAAQLTNNKEWHIGTLRGKRLKSPLILLQEDDLKLSLAGHVVHLLEMLIISENKLRLNKEELIKLVDSPDGSNETAENRRKRLKTRVAEERSKGTKAFLQTVADEEGISVSRIKQITSKPS